MNTSNSADLLQLLINLSGAFEGIFKLILAIFALVGLVMFGQAMIDMYTLANPSNGVRMSQKQATPAGITWKLFVSVVLTSLVYVSVLTQNTLIGDTASSGLMNYQGAGPSEMQKAAWKAIKDLFALGGYVLFAKGWMKLSDHFNGGQVSVGMAIWQIIGSTLMIFIDVWLAKLSLWTGFDFVNILLF